VSSIDILNMFDFNLLSNGLRDYISIGHKSNRAHSGHRVKTLLMHDLVYEV
jgi:hypothetical protein